MSTESSTLGPPGPAAVGGTTTEYANRGWILAVMCLALVMVVAGVSMLANALPSIAADLDASQSSQQWIVDAYALTLAALLLPAGAVGDRFGRRGALIAGTAIFGGAAGLSALAGSANELIALRALMGIGAALLMPGTLSTITSVFPPEERVSFDIRGSIVSAIGIGLLVLGIIEGPERGWTDPVTLIGLLGGAVFLATFVWVELRTDEPLLDPRLFGHRGFATGSASLFLQFFAMFGFFFVSLQFLQLVLGYSTLDAALALLPMSIVILPISAVAGTMSEKYGHRLVGGAGLAISGVGFALFAMLGTDSGFFPFMLVTIVIGVGAALAMTPATNAIVASLPRAKQGVASAVNDTARELGAAFGVAVLGSAFNIGYRHGIDADLTSFPADVAHQAREAPAIAVALSRQIPGGEALATAAREAFTTGMRYAVLVGAGLLVVGALFVWFRGASRVEEVVEDDLDTLEAAAA